jgi:hypothetical protein
MPLFFCLTFFWLLAEAMIEKLNAPTNPWTRRSTNEDKNRISFLLHCDYRNGLGR